MKIYKVEWKNEGYPAHNQRYGFDIITSSDIRRAKGVVRLARPEVIITKTTILQQVA